ncbi:MAG: hypothetical protein V4675_25075 [Verrucomicrobiota bacterium]
MKRFITFLISTYDTKYKTKGKIEPDQFDQIRREFPEFWRIVPNPFMAYLSAPVEGERTKQLLSFIESIGLRPYWARFPHVNEMPVDERWIEINGKIEFEPHDFGEADYFEVCMREFPEMGEGTRNPDGSAWVERFDVNVELGHIISVGSLYAQASMKEKLMAAGWKGLVMPEMHQISGLPVPLWQMQSDCIMPPAANRWYQDPFFRGKESNYGLYDESIFEPWPAQYRREDLTKMDGIDFAYAHEWIGKGPPLGYRKLFCCKQFYTWATDKQLPFVFVPVLVLD